jgi:hypothetical protein
VALEPVQHVEPAFQHNPHIRRRGQGLQECMQQSLSTDPSVQRYDNGSLACWLGIRREHADLTDRPVKANIMSPTAHEGHAAWLSSSRARHMITLGRSLPATTYRGAMHQRSTRCRRDARQSVHTGRTCREDRLESHDATMLRICCENAIRAGNLRQALKSHTMHAVMLALAHSARNPAEAQAELNPV